MKQPITFQGRSFLFNILFVLLNLIGLTLVVLGFHYNFQDSGLTFKIVGFLLMALTISGLLIFKGRMMMSSDGKRRGPRTSLSISARSAGAGGGKSIAEQMRERKRSLGLA